MSVCILLEALIILLARVLLNFSTYSNLLRHTNSCNSNHKTCADDWDNKCFAQPMSFHRAASDCSQNVHNDHINVKSFFNRDLARLGTAWTYEPAYESSICAGDIRGRYVAEP